MLYRPPPAADRIELAHRAFWTIPTICDETENDRNLVAALRAACDFAPRAITCAGVDMNTRLTAKMYCFRSASCERTDEKFFNACI
ncbi:hypothetical protein BBJ66_24825 [Rhizobium sp. RSm-3]|nr:hypothetical protein BBJ66_24825 [Rhizobium sp. RSm-3]